MSTVKNLKADLAIATGAVKGIRNDLKKAQELVKSLRAQLKNVRATEKANNVAKREAARKARIEKMEAKLLALKSIAGIRKQNRKASPVTVIVENGKQVA